MAEAIGLPAPPPVGESALKPGTFDGVPVVDITLTGTFLCSREFGDRKSVV